MPIDRRLAAAAVVEYARGIAGPGSTLRALLDTLDAAVDLPAPSCHECPDETIAEVVRRIRVYERDVREAKERFQALARRHEEALRPLEHALGLAELALEELLEVDDPQEGD